MSHVFYTYTVLLTTIQNSKLFTGTKTMLADMSTALLILVPSVGTVAIIVCVIAKAAAGEQEQEVWKKRIKSILVGVGIAFLASALISIIAHYYT